jgi:mannose-6-phosphate isomerase-like protein (cupin superfamily)
MNVRRVATGHDADGKAVFASDAEVKPITSPVIPGLEFHRLWGGDGHPIFPNDGVLPNQTTYFPPVGGYRFGFFTLPPAGATGPPPEVDVSAAFAELEASLPGMLGHMEMDNPGMHTTNTIDFEVVLSGRIVLELDDGAETELHPGDTVVQNGTRHRWTNPGDEPAVIAVFMVGADRR